MSLIVVKVLKIIPLPFPPGGTEQEGIHPTGRLGGLLFLFFLLCPFSISKGVAMFRKVSNSDIFYVASFRHVTASAENNGCEGLARS